MIDLIKHVREYQQHKGTKYNVLFDKTDIEKQSRYVTLYKNYYRLINIINIHVYEGISKNFIEEQQLEFGNGENEN